MIKQAEFLSAKGKRDGALLRNHCFENKPELIDKTNANLIEAIKAKLSLIEKFKTKQE